MTKTLKQQWYKWFNKLLQEYLKQTNNWKTSQKTKSLHEETGVLKKTNGNLGSQNTITRTKSSVDGLMHWRRKQEEGKKETERRAQGKLVKWKMEQDITPNLNNIKKIGCKKMWTETQGPARL